MKTFIAGVFATFVLFGAASHVYAQGTDQATSNTGHSQDTREGSTATTGGSDASK